MIKILGLALSFFVGYFLRRFVENKIRNEELQEELSEKQKQIDRQFRIEKKFEDDLQKINIDTSSNHFEQLFSGETNKDHSARKTSFREG